MVNLVVTHRYLSNLKHEQNNKETKRDFFVGIVFFWQLVYIIFWVHERSRFLQISFISVRNETCNHPPSRKQRRGRILTDTTLKQCNVDTSNVRRKKLAWSFGCYTIYTILAHWDLNQLPWPGFLFTSRYNGMQMIRLFNRRFHWNDPRLMQPKMLVEMDDNILAHADHVYLIYVIQWLHGGERSWFEASPSANF